MRGVRMVTLYPTRVTITGGSDGVPSRLVVVCDLGHGFAALPPVDRDAAIERALSDALVVATQPESEELPCPPNEGSRPSPASVAA